MARKQPARLVWPLTPSQVESLDEMLYELYGRTDTTGTASGSSSASSGVVVSGIGPPGFDGADGEDGIIGPPGAAGAAGATGGQGATGRGVPGIDGEDADTWVFQGPQGIPGTTGPQGAAGASIQSAPGVDGEDAMTWVVPGPQGVPGTASRTTSMGIVIDGGGSAITTGLKGDLAVPIGCTIVSVTMLADQSGSIVVDIWKQTYGSYPPVVGNSITASALPTITTAVKSQDTTLTGWTTSVAAGDTLRFNVNSVTSITRLTLSLKVTVP